LLLLRVGQDGLNLALVFLADLQRFRPDFLRVTVGLGLFHQRFDLLLHILNDAHELLQLLVRDFQFFHNLGPAQGKRSSLLQFQLLEPFELLGLQGLL
jgi:hypothetical protein